MNRREAGLAVLFLGDLATCVTFGDWAGALGAQGNVEAIERFGLPLEPEPAPDPLWWFHYGQDPNTD